MMEKEDRFLLSHLEDLICQRDSKSIPVCTGFLDLRQQSLVQNYCEKNRISSYQLWGGFLQAERCVCALFPDWGEEVSLLPIAAVRVRTSSALIRKLAHRDYLGALMGLGLKREKIGDILVSDNGADILTFTDTSSILCSQFTQAGQARLAVKPIPLQELLEVQQKPQIRRDTVASLRLDSILGAAFPMSRSAAVECIEAGRVFVNGIQEFRKDRKLEPGDKLTLRGKGKIVLRQTLGVSKKERIFVELEIYQ